MATNHRPPLETIDDFIMRRQGTAFEADLFAILRDYPNLIRSFEFALADGALLVTPETVPSTSNYSE